MKRQIIQLIILFTAHIFSLLLLLPGKANVQAEENCCSPKVTLEVADTPVETTICDEAEPIALAVPPDKETTAPDPIPTAYTIPDLSYGEDGTLYGPDMQENFVGDPFSDWGYICGVPAILAAANNYLTEQGSSHIAVDQTGASPESLYELVSQNIPVVVWVTIEMADRYDVQGWYTESGEYMEWCTQDHGAVLIGYAEETVAIADPISGMMEYDREQFESVFESRGRQCAIICETQEVEV